MKKLQVFNPHEIEKLLEFLHDRSYSLEDIEFDQSQKILRIPVTVFFDDQHKTINFETKGKKDKLKHPLFKAELKIKNVENYEVQDEAEIGEGDINSIFFEDGRIRIIGGIPVEITIAVTALEMELHISDTIVKWVSSFRRSYLKS